MCTCSCMHTPLHLSMRIMKGTLKCTGPVWLMVQVNTFPLWTWRTNSLSSAAILSCVKTQPISDWLTEVLPFHLTKDGTSSVCQDGRKRKFAITGKCAVGWIGCLLGLHGLWSSLSWLRCRLQYLDWYWGGCYWSSTLFIFVMVKEGNCWCSCSAPEIFCSWMVLASYGTGRLQLLLWIY